MRASILVWGLKPWPDDLKIFSFAHACLSKSGGILNLSFEPKFERFNLTATFVFAGSVAVKLTIPMTSNLLMSPNFEMEQSTLSSTDNKTFSVRALNSYFTSSSGSSGISSSIGPYPKLKASLIKSDFLAVTVVSDIPLTLDYAELFWASFETIFFSSF